MSILVKHKEKRMKYEIEYIEKPKRLYFDILEAKAVSCIPQVTLRPPFLTGAGCLVAVLDSGIDYQNPVFRNADGSSRILFLWDQTVEPNDERGFNPPEGFALGVEFTKEQIDRALLAETRQEALALVPSQDFSGHGTGVAAVAASSNPDRLLQGVAPGSNLLVVKLIYL